MKKNVLNKAFISLLAISFALSNASCSLYNKVFCYSDKKLSEVTKKEAVKKSTPKVEKKSPPKNKAKVAPKNVVPKAKVAPKNVVKVAPKKANAKKLILAFDPIFTSNMVLQQDAPITFYGKSAAKAKVTVNFAGLTVKVKANSKGAWKAQFPAMKGGFTPYTVVASIEGKTITLSNILIGEVWFCSGQSNMQMPVGAKFKRGWTAKNCETEVAKANYPYIRYASQALIGSHRISLPARLRETTWVVTSPLVTAKYSATAYFFGRELFKKLNVPIGLINASWGGTKIEPWIPQDCFKGIRPDEQLVKKYDLPKDKLKKLLDADEKRYLTEYNVWEKAYNNFEKDKLNLPLLKEFYQLNFNAKNWATSIGAMINCSGTYLYRAKFILPKRLINNKNINLFVPQIAPKAVVYLNGKEIGSWTGSMPASKRNLILSLPQSFFNNGDNVIAIKADYYRLDRHARFLMGQLPNVRVSNGSAMINKLPFKVKLVYKASIKDLKMKSLVGPFSLPFQSHQFQGALYNGMVEAWTKLPIRGVIWYQGCSNAGQKHYYVLHKRLIESWRKKWNNPTMPFLIVQLAGFEPSAVNTWKTSNPTKVSGYALTRDIQQEMLKVKNVGLACAIDIGEARNIHPANKQDVGLRLALEAQRIAYGKKIVSQGPLYKSCAIEGNKIRVFFNNADSGLITSDKKAPNGFAIAGADGNFVWANATIDGKTVVVSSPKVTAPKYVRYAYVGYRGDLNLQNKAGLPAYPFTSLANKFSDKD